MLLGHWSVYCCNLGDGDEEGLTKVINTMLGQRCLRSCRDNVYVPCLVGYRKYKKDEMFF